MENLLNPINRRRVLTLLGGAGAVALIGNNKETLETVDAASCSPATPAVTEGPYWVEEKLFRSDIRTDPATGVARRGVPLTLNITVQNGTGSTCSPLTGAWVDIWHCDAIGIYSDEPANNPGGGTGMVVTTGQKFLAITRSPMTMGRFSSSLSIRAGITAAQFISTSE